MPKKAKKGGGGKGGAKTEEERLLHLQQRAQAEEELAKKKEEILALFLKDKLQKEEKNTAANLLKLNEGWRSILRQTRDAELREDIAVLSQTFERHVDGLDSVIKNLERDLQEAELQSARARRAHLQRMERLRAQQDKRVGFVQQQWEKCLQPLSCRFSSDRKQLLALAQQQRADLDDVMFSTEQQHDIMITEIHRLYEESVASYQSVHEHRVFMIRDNTRMLKEESLENQKATQLCNQELGFVPSIDRHFIHEVHADIKRAKRMQGLVIRLRLRLSSSGPQNQLVEQDLTAARNQAWGETQKLREQLNQARKAERKQLTDLTVQSDKAARKLKAVIAQGERVLRVGALCRKLESKHMNVSSALFPAEELGQETEDPAEGTSELRQLTRWVSAAVLQREALRRKREDLFRENQQLRLQLRRRLDAMTLSGDDALAGGLALLTVRQAPRAVAPAGSGGRHAVVEDAHVVRHSP